VSGRRVPGLAAAVAGVVGVGFLLLVSTAGPWVTGGLERPAPLPSETVSAGAAEVAPAVRALGVVVLAGAPALLAVRGRLRAAVGGVLLLAGAGALWATVGVVRDPGAAVAAGADVAVTSRPWLALAAAVGAIAVGALVVVRGGSWPALGRRYEAPAARRAAATGPVADGAQAWDALDRGEDPTGT
jgi:hypothetical protein